MNKRGPMPIEERAKRLLASYSKHGGRGKAKSFRKLGEAEQCKITEDILGESLKPARDGVYYLTCPGVSFHSTGSGRKDCRFTPGDGGSDARTAAPTLKCMHQSCGTVIEEMNRKIRSECGKASVEYMTDHGSVLNNAAAALIIGFDLKEAKAHTLLTEWGKDCEPYHSPYACGKAIKAALVARKKKPDEIGYLLKAPASAPHSDAAPLPSPPKKGNASFVPKQEQPGSTFAAAVPIYLGVKGKIAREARVVINAFTDDQGIAPDTLLLGSDQPELDTTHLCGLRIERMPCPGISVCRGDVGG